MAALGRRPGRRAAPLTPANLWRWADIRRLLLRAGEIRALDGGAGRRTVRLCMPGLEQKWATRTIHASFQLVKPGETAEAHRHSLAALRFVVEGRGGHTTVEGEKFIMEPGDLVLTPQYSWHDHANDGDEAMIWIDGHDGPLTLGLNAAFFERFSQPAQAVVHDNSSCGAAPARCGRAVSSAARKAIPISTSGTTRRRSCGDGAWRLGRV